MGDAGPRLEALTRRLAACPADFLAEPRLGNGGSVHVGAVVSDLLVDLGGAPLAAAEVEGFQRRGAAAWPIPSPALARVRAERGGSLAATATSDRNYLRMVLVACWLLHDPWFLDRPGLAGPAYDFLRSGLIELAQLVPAPTLIADADRREELVRRCLRALGLHPAGESAAQAEDRLAALDTLERQRVVAAARAAEERSRAIRAAMAKRAADKAAAKYSRE